MIYKHFFLKIIVCFCICYGFIASVSANSYPPSKGIGLTFLSGSSGITGILGFPGLTPPFRDTELTFPDIITQFDPSTLYFIYYSGTSQVRTFDRRVSDWVLTNVFLYQAYFRDGLHIEVQVNQEFGRADSEKQARFYAESVGRLPTFLRLKVETMWIHKGDELFGGGNNNILIHVGSDSDYYIRNGVLEEVLAHEAAHTSLDPLYKDNFLWTNAQNWDRNFISNYGRDYPAREDIAESIVAWIAVRYRSHRLQPNDVQTIKTTIPNRLRFFDGLNLQLGQFKKSSRPVATNSYMPLSTIFKRDHCLKVLTWGHKKNKTQVTRCVNYWSQQWKLVDAGHGLYRLKNRFRGDSKCLDVVNGGIYNNFTELRGCASYSGQYWKAIHVGNNVYRLKTLFRGDNMCLDVVNGGYKNNMTQLRECGNYSGQYWIMK